MQTLRIKPTLSMTARREAIIVHYFAPWLPVKVSRQIADSLGDYGNLTVVVISASAVKLNCRKSEDLANENTSGEAASRLSSTCLGLITARSV